MNSTSNAKQSTSAYPALQAAIFAPRSSTATYAAVPTENSAIAAAESRYPDIPEHLTTPTERTVRAIKKEAFALGFLAAGSHLPVPVEPEQVDPQPHEPMKG